MNNGSLQCLEYQHLAGNLMDGLGETLYVGGCDSSYGYSTVFGSIDMLKCVSVRVVPKWEYDTYLLGQLIHLLGLQSGVCEHTDLDVSA